MKAMAALGLALGLPFFGRANTFTPSTEVTSIACLPDFSANLHNTYFILYDLAGSVCVTMVLETPSGSNPGGCDREIEVAFAMDDIDTLIAQRVVDAINADGAWSASRLAEVVTVTDAAVGARVDAADVTTGFTIIVTTQGQ